MARFLTRDIHIYLRVSRQFPISSLRGSFWDERQISRSSSFNPNVKEDLARLKTVLFTFVKRKTTLHTVKKASAHALR